LAHPPLEEVLAEDRPHRRFESEVLVREAMTVEAGDVEIGWTVHEMR
jgi:hypothetical protein